MSPKNFWIVAIDHELQLFENANDPMDRSAQKEQLRALLAAEFPKRKVAFIAEEAKWEKETIASDLANASDPKIPWLNISMTTAERETAGIREALANRPGQPDETMEKWIQFRIPEDEIREDFFIRETLENGRDAQSILMLLGDMHVNAVGEKLLKLGHRVSINRDFFPVRRWQ